MPKMKPGRKERLTKLFEKLRRSFLEQREESGVEALNEIAEELRDTSKQHFYSSLRRVVDSAVRPEKADGTPLSHFGFSLLCEFRGLGLPPAEWPQECINRLRSNRNAGGARDLLEFLLIQ